MQLTILLSHPAFTKIEIFCSKLNGDLDKFIGRIFDKAVHIKDVVLHFDDDGMDGYLTEGSPDFISHISDSIRSLELDIGSDYQQVLQDLIDAKIDRNSDAKEMKSILTRIATNKISSLIDKLHSVASIPNIDKYINWILMS